MRTQKKFHGVVVPMATPFDDHGRLDEDAVTRILNFLAAGGINGILLLGTTGESASIHPDIKRQLVKRAVKEIGGKMTIYAGVSDNCLAQSVESAGDYFSDGADAVAAHLPCYYPLNAREQYHYYHNLAESVSGPLFLYNIPSLTHMSIDLDVVEKLSHHSRIAGIKDSENNPQRLSTLISCYKDRSDFSVLVGAAVLSAQGLAQGADGVVPSSGNLVPGLWKQLYQESQSGNPDMANELQKKADTVAQIYQNGPLVGQTLYLLKLAMSFEGLCRPNVLAPLCNCEDNGALHETIRKKMTDLGLLP